jgi:integrase
VQLPFQSYSRPRVPRLLNVDYQDLTSGLLCNMVLWTIGASHVCPQENLENCHWRGKGSLGVDYADQGGKRRLKTFKKKKEADAYHANTKVEIEQGVHVAPNASVTIAEAADLWLQSCSGLERATVTAYKQHVDIHIVPLMGREKLSELTAPRIRAFKDRLRQDRSAAMVKKIIGSLGAIVGDAQECGLVARNVVRDLRSRRKKGKEKQAARRQKGKLKIGVDIPARDEIRAIVENLKGRYRPVLLTAIFTGLRASELRGLRWRDVDLDKRELHVRQRADRYNEIGKPKSESGERSVPFPPLVANTLKEWKIACPHGDLVFPTGAGTVETHSNIVKRGLAPAEVAAGVVDDAGKAKYTGLHSLRHFYASWCINRKADGGLELPLKTVQSRLGHSTLAMTADTYGHLFPRSDDRDELEAAERVC